MITVKHADTHVTIYTPDHPGPIERQAEDCCYLLKLLYPVVWKYSRAPANEAPVLIGHSNQFGLVLLAEFSRVGDKPCILVYPLTSAQEHAYEIGALLFADRIGALARETALSPRTVLRSLSGSRESCRALAFELEEGELGTHAWKSLDSWLEGSTQSS